jgi:ubiquinone/menaquinone biosynthesis C-methylase UbiE
MQILADPKNYIEKEQLYYDVRNKEGRIISDAQLVQLPYVNPDNPYKKEWDIRAASLERLHKYLSKEYKNAHLRILDIGCGNGWMSKRLSNAGHSVTGVDLNMAELMQAEKVFGDSETLNWAYADVLSNELTGSNFDIILLAASCQYFADITALTNRLFAILNTGGEIHLLDSVFYKQNSLQAAHLRTVEYYKNLGYPEMGNYYFHHSVEEIKKLGYEKLYPGILSNSPLQWWKIAKV